MNCNGDQSNDEERTVFGAPTHFILRAFENEGILLMIFS
jgi:hypothetical protein